jgi:hypothetical protein
LFPVPPALLSEFCGTELRADVGAKRCTIRVLLVPAERLELQTY